MQQYLDLMKRVLDLGDERQDRTGVGTLSIFAPQIRFDLSEGFPLVTTKRIFWKGVVYELLWMLSGNTNIRYLQENGLHIWDEWADANGELGPVYPEQWRNIIDPQGRSIDQMSDLINGIRNYPFSRRHIVSSWNVALLDKMALPPCHCLFQFFVSGGKLSCQLYQRSADVFLGVPFNIASYALLTHMIAQQCDLVPHELVWTGGDVHLYKNHIEQARLQLQRKPLPLPHLELLQRPPSLFEYQYSDIAIRDYQHHAHIAADVAV